MISNKTLSYTISAVNSGRIFKLSPFIWSRKTGMFISTPVSFTLNMYTISCTRSGIPKIVFQDVKLYSWKFVLCFSMCFKFMIVIYWIVFAILFGSSLEENVLLVFLTSNCLTSFCVQVMYISSHQELVCFINTLLVFDRKLGN